MHTSPRPGVRRGPRTSRHARCRRGEGEGGTVGGVAWVECLLPGLCGKQGQTHTHARAAHAAVSTTRAPRWHTPAACPGHALAPSATGEAVPAPPQCSCDASRVLARPVAHPHPTLRTPGRRTHTWYDPGVDGGAGQPTLPRRWGRAVSDSPGPLACRECGSARGMAERPSTARVSHGMWLSCAPAGRARTGWCHTRFALVPTTLVCAHHTPGIALS